MSSWKPVHSCIQIIVRSYVIDKPSRELFNACVNMTLTNSKKHLWFYSNENNIVQDLKVNARWT